MRKRLKGLDRYYTLQMLYVDLKRIERFFFRYNAQHKYAVSGII